MKILIIPTGGTICTGENARGTLSIQERAGIKIVENYKTNHKDDTTFVVADNLMILSENMTVNKWNKILDAYRENIEKDHYDGVIFLHGTDTLGYTASLFSLILKDTQVPVIFVSANKPLDDKCSNGNENFKKAVECIKNGIAPNVYVTYKNISDGKMYVHFASRICQCGNYSEDFYSSQVNETKESTTKPIPDDVSLKNCILKITPYVGMDYSGFDIKNYKAILHSAYHSGTVCTEEDTHSVMYLIKKCEELGVDLYISPSQFYGKVYESTEKVRKENVNSLYGMTDECAYAKLLLAYSLFDDKEKIKEFIETEQNLEFIYEKR